MFWIQCNKNLLKGYYVTSTMLDLLNIKLNKTLFLAFNMYSLIVFCDYLRTIFLQSNPSIFYLTWVFSSPLLSVNVFISKINILWSTGVLNWCTRSLKAPAVHPLKIWWLGAHYSLQKDSVSVKRKKHSVLLYKIFLRKVRLIIIPTIKRRMKTCGHGHKGSQWQRSGLIAIISAP